MSSTAYFVPRQIEINTAQLDEDPGLYEEIVSYHYKSTREDPAFRCLEPEGMNLPMKLVCRRDEDGRPAYHLAHFADDNAGNHKHDTFSKMSVEHKRQTEYVERAAQSAGLETQREYSTGKGTRLDLAVFGKRNIGFEIQKAALSADGKDGAATSRTAKSFDAGWQAVWITTKAPAWLRVVPSVRISCGNWSEELPAPGTVWAIVHKFHTETSWQWNQSTMLRLDDLIPLIASADIIPVATADGVMLTHAADLDMIKEFDGCGVWTPEYKPKAKSASRTRRCHSHEEPEPEPEPVKVVGVRLPNGTVKRNPRQWATVPKAWVAPPPPTSPILGAREEDDDDETPTLTTTSEPPACPECRWRPWPCFRDQHAPNCSRKAAHV